MSSTIVTEPGDVKSVIPWQEKSLGVLKLLKGDLQSESDRSETLNKAGIELPEKNLICIASKDYTNPNELFQVGFYPSTVTIFRTLNELLSHFGNSYGCVLRNQTYINIISLEHTPDFERVYNLKKEIGNVLHDYFQKTYNIALTVKLSDLVQNFNLLSDEFLKLIEEPEKDNSHLSLNKPVDKYLAGLKYIFNSLDDMDSEGIESSFSEMIANIKNNRQDSKEVYYGICFSVINYIDNSINTNKFHFSEWNNPGEINLINKCRSTEDYKEYLVTLKERLKHVLINPGYSNQIVQNVKKYIEKNFSDYDLDLENIAEYNNVTPNHLCKIFKKEMNTSPIQYLTQVRLNRSKHLLKTTDKQIKEIANLVGYRNAYYFSRLFKKSTGLTPLEYKKR